MSTVHLINRLNFEVHGFKNNQEYQKFANRLSAIVRTSLSSRLSRLLEQLNFHDYHIIIDYLHIDLGLINMRNLENNLLSKIEKQLNKVIPSIKIQIIHKIKTGELDDFLIRDNTQTHIKQIIEKNLKSYPGPIKADVDITLNAHKKAFDTKVIPSEAKYLDAVIHYMEHGYFSRQLYVSDEVFADVFTTTVLKYQKEITRYFGLKSKQKNTTALERFQKQISSSNLVKSNDLPTRKKTEKLFDNLYHEKIQTLVKAVDLMDLELDSPKKRKKEIVEYLTDLYKSKKSISNLAEAFQEIDKKVAKSETLMPDDLNELNFKKNLNILLDERDRRTFDEFLKDPFVLSLNKSYISNIDSIGVITQALLNIISNPNKRSEILNALPYYIEKEADLITQIYKKSPAMLLTLFQQNKNFNSEENTRLFLNNLPKKHLNLVMRSMISYYSKLEPILNYINEVQHDDKMTKQTHYSQIGLMLNLLESPVDLSSAITEFVDKSLSAVDSLSETKAKKEKFSKLKKIVKKRVYKKHEQMLRLSVDNAIRESIPYKDDPAALSVYQLKTLLTQYYIPFVVKDQRIVSYNIETVIKNLVKVQKNKPKSRINELFDPKKVLKNSALRNLSYANFKDLLYLSLPTDAMRKYISLFDKYGFLWKNTVDQGEAQLIFLSLLTDYKNVNEATIFGHYYDKLKIFKAWNTDVQRKRIVENYELHSEKLRQADRSVIIKYIDNIPTLESLAAKESRKKLENGIPVKNAGLVLLWPFMKTLFNLCDYLNKQGDFIDGIAKERAVLLLQYIAVKSSSVEEPYLALNKILTGFPLEESIASEIILTDKEKDIADALLINVIKQWPSFQNSSADNLRGSFLIRDGILYFKGGQWVLQVEKKSYDLLLGKLPWGFSLITLSWLTYMVKVEWN